MRNILLCLVVLLLCVMPNLAANDEQEKIAELSKRIEELTTELNELTTTLQDTVKQTQAEPAEDTSNEAEVSVTQNNVDEILAAIEKIAQNQVELKREIDELKEPVEPVEEVETVEADDTIYVGEETTDSGGVLYQYGNANDVDSNRIYVEDEPEYIVEPQRRSKVGIRLYFGTGGRRRYYNDRWDDPWAIDPPWWVRDKYYRRHR